MEALDIFLRPDCFLIFSVLFGTLQYRSTNALYSAKISKSFHCVMEGRRKIMCFGCQVFPVLF